MQALERSINNLDWITLVLVGCLCLLALTKYAYERRFLNFTEALVNKKYMATSTRDIKFENPFNFLLLVVQLLSISMFMYLVCDTFRLFTRIDPLVLFLRIFIFYSLFVGVKFLTERIIGVLFNGEIILKTYHYHKLVQRNFIAVLLLPFNALFIYGNFMGPSTVWVAIGILLLLNVILLVSTLRDYEKTITNNWFYFILYLCALEIAPYFILFKLFSTYLPH